MSEFDPLVFSEVVMLLERERKKQVEKWGDQSLAHADERWLCILTEEVGELAQAILQCPTRYVPRQYAIQTPAPIRTELIQIAAVAIAWLEALDTCDVLAGNHEELLKKAIEPIGQDG